MVFGSSIGPLSNIGITLSTSLFCDVSNSIRIGQFFLISPQLLNDLGDINALSDQLDHTISQFVWALSFTPFSQWDFVAMKGEDDSVHLALRSYPPLNKGIAFGTDSESRSMTSRRPADWTPLTNANKTLPLLLIAGDHDSISS